MRSRHMKTHIILMFMSVWLTGIAVANTVPPLSQMVQAASELRLPLFIQAIHTNRWHAPAIYSKWHIENRQQSQGIKQQSEEARSLGRYLVERLDEAASDMLSRTGKTETVTMVSQLFELSDWLTEADGYGNLLLAARCHDIATVGLGRLTADLAFPLETVSALMARLDAPWNSPATRARVINAEIGTNLISVSSKSADVDQQQLEDAWQNGELLALRRNSPEIDAVLRGKKVQGFESLSLIAAARGLFLNEAASYTNNLGFFEDMPISSQPQPRTTANLWNVKWHRKLVLGFDSKPLEHLKALLIFREHVKEFPLALITTPEQEAAAAAEIAAAAKKGVTIVSFESFYSSPGEAAFAKAWQRYATDKTRNLDAAAWRAYKEITSGEFVDQDTREKRLDAQMKGTADPDAQ